MVGWDTYFERLGPQGLRLVIAGLLDEESAARLAGRPLDGLSAADRGRLLADAFAEQPDLGPPLLEALDARGGLPDASERDEARVRDELAALLRNPDPAAARFLHRLARPQRPALGAPEIRAAAEVLAAGVLGEDPGTRPKWLARSASDRAGLRELEIERRELETRVRQLEAQQGRLLERSADLESELGRRTAELRQLRLHERSWREDRRNLEKEVARLEKRIEELNERRAREGTGVIASALRRLTTENRRAAAQLEKLRKERAAERRDPAWRRLLALADTIGASLAERAADGRAASAVQDEILRELGALRAEVAGRRGPRAEGAPPRVGLFVDVQNMFYGAREKNARLDFEALLQVASEGRQLVRAVAYLVETRDIDQSAFIHLLQVKNYEVKRKPLRIRPDGSMKGNWDLEIALDALSTAEHLDVVVLVTGDGDFVPLVRALRLRGVSVEVYGFPRSTAPDLREVVDRFVPVSRRLLRPLPPSARPSRPAPGAASSGGNGAGTAAPNGNGTGHGTGDGAGDGTGTAAGPGADDAAAAVPPDAPPAGGAGPAESDAVTTSR